MALCNLWSNQDLVSAIEIYLPLGQTALCCPGIACSTCSQSPGGTPPCHTPLAVCPGRCRIHSLQQLLGLRSPPQLQMVTPAPRRRLSTQKGRFYSFLHLASLTFWLTFSFAFRARLCNLVGFLSHVATSCEKREPLGRIAEGLVSKYGDSCT